MKVKKFLKKCAATGYLEKRYRVAIFNRDISGLVRPDADENAIHYGKSISDVAEEFMEKKLKMWSVTSYPEYETINIGI